MKIYRYVETRLIASLHNGIFSSGVEYPVLRSHEYLTKFAPSLETTNLMSLEATINEDLKTAMKAKDQAALRGIRAIKSAILLYNTSGASAELNAEGEIALLQKLVKQRQDSLDIFGKQGREDLAAIEREEIEVIMRYLPKQLSEEELKSAVKDIMSRLGATSMKDMGKVMAEASKEFAGKADGKTISAVVKAMLS
jgi:uncharacterized protein